MIAFIIWLIVGAIAGALAGMAMGGRNYNMLTDILLGIVGSFIGGWLLSLFGVNISGNDITGLIGSIITAFIGAVVLIALVRALPGRSPV